MKHIARRLVVPLLMIALLMNLCPAAAFAAESQTPAETVSAGSSVPEEAAQPMESSASEEPVESSAPEEPTESARSSALEEPAEKEGSSVQEEAAESAELESSQPQEDAVEALRQLLAELPAAEDLPEMTGEDRNAVYDQLQAVYEAFQSLNEEEKAQLPEAEEIFSALFDFFNSQIAPLAATEGVPYYDPTSQETRTAENATTVTASTTTWGAGWYVVKGTVTAEQTIRVSGRVNLILATGSNLTAKQGIRVAGSGRLTIWGQNADYAQDGTLVATGSNGSAGIGSGPTESGTVIVNINGGNVTGNGGSNGVGIGGGGGNNNLGSVTVNINGGNVTGDGGNNGAGIGGGNGGRHTGVTISGGTVHATGGSDAAGIGPGKNSGYTFGYHNTDTVEIIDGEVTATGGSDAAGIGAGYSDREDSASYGLMMANPVSVDISGGTVHATGGGNSAGIGGSAQALETTVDISGGVVTGTGTGAGAGIGSGNRTETGTEVIISGGTVTGHGGTSAAADIGNGGRVSTGTTVAISNGSVLGETVQPQPTDGDGTTVYLLKLANPKEETVTIGGKAWSPANHAADGGDENLYAWVPGEDQTVTIGGTEYTYQFQAETGTFKLDKTAFPYYDPEKQALQKPVVVTTLSSDLANWNDAGETDGWYAVDREIAVDQQIRTSGDVNLILASGSSLTAKQGILVESGSLTIWGQNENASDDGRLTAAGGRNYAGIGFNSAPEDSSITIKGGRIEATGGYNGAGIGSSYASSGSCGVRIQGGVVTATGGSNGAGIGLGSHNQKLILNVTIEGGVVTAKGDGFAAGIGSSSNADFSSSVVVTIKDGTVTAEGSWNSAGIGGHSDSRCSVNVTIEGGAVQAKGENAPGIGEGNYSRMGSETKVEITGGTVTATGRSAPGIGAASRSSGSVKTTITGGSVKSTASRQPTDGSTQVYLLKVQNPDGSPVTIGGKAWSPANHQALDPEDSYLYAWVPGQDQTVTVDGKEIKYIFQGDTFLSDSDCDWDNAFWSWAADYSSATLTVPRLGGGTPLTQTVKTDSEKVPPTCEKAGSTTYTAKVTVFDHPFQDTRSSVTEEPLGHNWDLNNLEYDVDGDDLTVTISCKNDSSHTRTVYPILERRDLQKATCAENGEGKETYRMYFLFEGTEHELDEATYTLERVPHSWGQWEEIESSPDSVTYRRTCTVCGETETSSHMHTYQFPGEAQWNLVNNAAISATVEVTCEECGRKETLTFSGEQIHEETEKEQEPTCTTVGRKVYWVEVELGGQKRTYTTTTETPAKGHTWTWQEGDVQWSADHTTATFTFRCEACGETLERTVESSVTVQEEPKCEINGKVQYSASAQYGSAEATASEIVTLPATGHDWDPTTVVEKGVEGGFTTVTIACKNDKTHTQTLHAFLVGTEKKDATCTQAGSETYQMEYSFGGNEYSYGEPVTYDIPALGHLWDENHKCIRCGQEEKPAPGVTYTWKLPENGDTNHVQWTSLAAGRVPYVTVTATREVGNGKTEDYPVVLNEVSVTKREEKCEEVGQTTYEAVLTLGDQKKTYTTTMADVPPTGHLWMDDEVEWDTASGKAKIHFVCLNDESHTETIEALATVDTVREPDCETAGLRRYSAMAQLDDATVETETYQEIEPTGHAWCFAPDGACPPKLNRTQENGETVYSVTVTCENDHSHQETTTEIGLEPKEVLKEASCTQQGAELYEITYVLDGTTHVLGEEVYYTPMTPHEWGEWTVTENPDGSETFEHTCTVCGEVETSDHIHVFSFPEEAEWNIVNGQLVSATVTRTCQETTPAGKVCGKTEVWTFPAGSEEITKERHDPTCEEDGSIVYTLTVEGHSPYTYTQKLHATGHWWTKDGEPEWSSDNSEATFHFVCRRDPSHKAEQTVPVERKVLTEPTCTEPGQAYLSAVAQQGGTTASANQVVEIPALGHDFQNGVCTRCGAKDPNYTVPSQPAEEGPGGGNPNTGESTALPFWTVLLLAGAGTGVLAAVLRRRIKR